MRDIALTILIFGLLPLILWRPYIGLLVWSWLSYMNPHRSTWGFAYDMPFAQIVAITLLVSMLFSSEKYRMPWSGTLVLWITFVAWMLLSTLNAIYPDAAMIHFSKVIKIQFISLLTLMLITDRRKLHALICVIVASIGFYAVKGGVFTLLTGGAFHVYGPADSDISENNALALATLIIIPLMIYLYQVHKGKVWLRLAIGGSIVLSVVAVFGSQSRGALVAIAAVGFFFWLKTSRKIISGAGIVLLGALVFSFMPASWHQRMDTITTYEQDASAMSRIHAWNYSLRMANDRFTGGGFGSWSKRTYAAYAPEATGVFVAHSIYFSVLADHGWIGLILYLTILFMVWRNLAKVIAGGVDADSPYLPVQLARMLQVSLIAYCSGGAFLSLSYFDLPWHIIAISLLLSYWAKQESDPAVQSQNRNGKSTGLRYA